MLISIIIPAYNEEKRIGKTLEKYLEYFDTHYPENYEILVVLNGCRDHTEEVVQKFQNIHPVGLRYLVYPEPIGKGGAIKKGLEDAKGDFIGYTDADGSTSAAMMDKLFQIAIQNPQIGCVLGSRSTTDSVVIGKTSKRMVLSRGFNFGVNLLFFLGIKDTQCGAKVLPRQIVQKVLPKLIITTMAFDVNLLVDVRKAGGTLKEVGIVWEDDPNSTVSSFKTSLAMALSVIHLRILYSPFKFLDPIIEPVGHFLFSKAINRRKAKI